MFKTDKGEVSKTWTFALPTGEVVDISLPEQNDSDWVDKIELVMEKIEKVYPYMGFRPGILAFNNTVFAQEPGLDALDTEQDALNRLHEPHVDLASYAFVPIADFISAPLANRHDRDAAQWGGFRYGVQDILIYGVGNTTDFAAGEEEVGFNDTFHDNSSSRPYVEFGVNVSLGTIYGRVMSEGTETLDFQPYLYGIFLWWPPEEYAAIVTEADANDRSV